MKKKKTAKKTEKINFNLLKKVLFSILIFLVIFTGCKKDDNEPVEPQINYTSDGLQEDILPIQQDTIIANSTMTIEVLNQDVTPNDFSNDYQLKLQGFNPEKVKKGTVIADFKKSGRLWVIREVNSQNGDEITINAVMGSLATFFSNLILEVSTPGNRTKNGSVNPNKLDDGRLKFITALEPFNVDTNVGSSDIENIVTTNGVSISVNDNTIEVNFTDFELYSNASGTFSVKIPEGRIEMNNAVDFRLKYTPFDGLPFYYGIPMQLGKVNDFKTAIYSDIDSDLTLEIEATTNNLISDSFEREIGSYKEFVPIPPYGFVTVKVELIAKLETDIDATLNYTTQYVSKNNFEVWMDYDGTKFTDNNAINFENIESEITGTTNSNINLHQRLEIIPKIELLAYGLIGPTGQITSYADLNFQTDINNGIADWDTDFDIGLDYEASLDVSFLHMDNLTSEFFPITVPLVNYDVFTSPFEAELISGNEQTGNTNQSLTEPIVIKIKDNFGNPVQDAVVYFITTADNGAFLSDTVNTNQDGEASNLWTLGSSIGNQEAQVYVKNGAGNIIADTQLSLSATAEASSVSLPTLTTNSVTNITSNSATSGGTITSDGGATITESGLVWSTNPNPNLTNSSTNDGSLTGNFTSEMTILTESTTYYVRAYATNSEGTGYGNDIQFTTESSTNIYNGDVTLTTQQEVDDFGANNYTSITGNLTIGTSDDIVNLEILNTINSIGGYLRVTNNNILTNVEGLRNISSIGNYISISYNNALNDLGDLRGITSVIGGFGIYIEDNDSLTNLNGLHNITSITGHINIQKNDILNSLEALSNITSVSGRLVVVINSNLTNLEGLRNINSIGEYIEIYNNDSLTNLCGIKQLIINNSISSSEYTVFSNAYNPTYAQIQNTGSGGCEQ